MTRSLTFGDLVLCAGTVPTASFEEMVEAAALAGYAGVSVRPGAVLEAIQRLGSPVAVVRLLDDHGIAVADFDAMVDWVIGVDPPASLPRSALLDQDLFLETAAAVGARSINVVEFGAGSTPLDLLARSFARICDRAAEFGLLVHVEFFEGSSVKDLSTASQVVRQAGRPNGGVLLDTFHLHRGPSRSEVQLPAGLDLVTMLQVSDAAATPAADPRLERASGRLLPGRGVIDLADILGSLQRAGSSAPIGLEVNNAALHAMPVRQAAQEAADAARAVLAQLTSS